MFYLAAEHIDVSGWTEAALLVRVYDVSFADTNDKIQVIVAADGWSPDTPGDVFIGADLATQELNSTHSGAVPEYVLTELTTPFGPLVAVAVSGNRSSSSAGGTMSATISVAISVKDASGR